MIITSTTARILLGLAFVFTGLVPFVFPSPPPQPGLAGVFYLINRFVPVALIITAAFLYNSFAFHLGTSPALLPLPLVAMALWLLVALPYRTLFAPIFAARPKLSRSEKLEVTVGDFVR